LKDKFQKTVVLIENCITYWWCNYTEIQHIPGNCDSTQQKATELMAFAKINWRGGFVVEEEKNKRFKLGGGHFYDRSYV
jgi:hypothetical protein